MGFSCDRCGSQELWQMATYVMEDGSETRHPLPADMDDIVGKVCRDCAKVCPCGGHNRFCVRCAKDAGVDVPKVGPESP